MTKPSITQSQKRFSESLGSLFNVQGKKKKLLFLRSSSDVGVMRNGGRNGAQFAPQSFLSVFKKLNLNEKTQEYALAEIEVACIEEEAQNFSEAQVRQSERIEQAFKHQEAATICHLGGGHDHIYPLLKALAKSHKRIVVINIDAHADTRTDDQANSGTPFRQFANEHTGHFELFQIGLHAFANSTSTLSPLNQGQMHVLWREELKQPARIETFFKEIASVASDADVVVFSLDADAMDGSEVPGVSAVNPNGITREELFDLWKRYAKLNLKHPPILGIYELNPVFDAPSMLSMRRMTTFVYGIMV